MSDPRRGLAGRSWARLGGSALVGVGLLLAVACGEAGTPADPAADSPAAIPEPDMTEMEPLVRSRLVETRAAVEANPQSGAAWGRFGKVAHAHDLWSEATVAYRQAWKLEPENPHWPYYLGDVLSIVGTDLDEAEKAFRRAMALYPDYAPAHMRLGKVLLARDQGAAAAIELERALELASDLEPARVALAQLRLAQGELEASLSLLEDVLERSPRYGQALATLGQVYMRLGRRDEAREIAERARDPASYNLYSDPLMDEVVSEGVSSVLLWERAKSFLENRNYQQAVLGLQQVVGLLPENPEVHLQLAVAYGGLGQLERARHHLERTVELDPEQVEAKVRLANFHLEQQAPAAAVPHLEAALELSPERLDLGWLLGRARLLAGDPQEALASFETAAAAGGEAPLWAHNEWGSALAQTGRLSEALEHFQATLLAVPNDAQALFYSGLALEGLGRADEAVERYCRSLEAQPNPPATARLRAIGHSCG